MKKAPQTLQEQLDSKQKEVALILKKIEDQKKATQPKSIMDRVKTMKDVLKIAKLEAEELKLIKYSGKSKRMLFAKHMAILSLISEVLNEGHIFTMTSSEERWYPWYEVSSRFVFGTTLCDGTSADTGSAARLCLKSEELAIHAGKIFLKEYKNAITLQ